MRNKTTLVFLLLVFIGQVAFSDNIDEEIISFPMFDDRMSGVDIKFINDTDFFSDMELKNKKGIISVNTSAKIIGRKLFPVRDYHNFDISWNYYIEFQVDKTTKYGCVSDKYFIFDSSKLVDGIYSFSFIPKNDIYPILSQKDIKLYITTIADNRIIYLGFIEKNSFIALVSSKIVANNIGLYNTFILQNMYLVIPIINGHNVVFSHINNEFGADQSAPMIILESQESLPVVSRELYGFAICNDYNVRIRDKPGLNGIVLGEQLNKPDKVVIIDKNNEKQKINKNFYYWYHIRTFSGLEGWVYGEYLNLIIKEWE